MPSTQWLHGEFCQTFKEELPPVLLILFQKSNRREHFLILYEATITLIPKPYTDIARKLQTNIFYAKILNKILGNQIQQHIKRIIHLDQVRFILAMQKWFSIQNQSVEYITLTE